VRFAVGGWVEGLNFIKALFDSLAAMALKSIAPERMLSREHDKNESLYRTLNQIPGYSEQVMQLCDSLNVIVNNDYYQFADMLEIAELTPFSKSYFRLVKKLNPQLSATTILNQVIV
jgi:hypothetical protein